jgi:hypothetical protein
MIWPGFLLPAKESIMGESQLTLTVEERKCLVELLETALKETRIEEHRTRAPEYREHVSRREDLVSSLLGKLGQLAP